MIVTPGQLTQRAEFYHQLNQLTIAGIGLIPSLEQLQRNPPSFSYRPPLRRVLAELSQGATFAEALAHNGRWLPPFDITLIEAGEKSGRLDQSFRLLSDHYTDRARMAKQLIADLAYPVFLYHFAIFILAFVLFVRSGNWLLVLAAGLIPVYALALFVIYAGQSKHGETWRGWMERILAPVPLLGSGRRALALARLAAALEALLSAGVDVVEAWELAAGACGSPALRRKVLSWRPLILAGQTPAEVVSSSSAFPQLFANQYATGEVSGKLDETLRRLHGYYQDEGSRKLHAVAHWAPRLIYIAVLLIGGYIVIRLWMQYFNEMRKLSSF